MCRTTSTFHKRKTCTHYKHVLLICIDSRQQLSIVATAPVPSAPSQPYPSPPCPCRRRAHARCAQQSSRQPCRRLRCCCCCGVSAARRGSPHQQGSDRRRRRCHYHRWSACQQRLGTVRGGGAPSPRRPRLGQSHLRCTVCVMAASAARESEPERTAVFPRAATTNVSDQRGSTSTTRT